MLDFVNVTIKIPKKNECVLFPTFKIINSKDLMIRGKSFYAVWNESKGLWSTDEFDIQRLVDPMIKEAAEKVSKEHPELSVDTMYLVDSSNKKWNDYLTYVKSMPDNYHELDTKIIFSNTDVKKEDYASRKLSYPLKEGETKAYDELMNTLYNPDERDKLEWAIGAIIAGDSKKIQKFLVLYGEAGTGKSTVLNIIQELFEGYYSVFEAKALASANNAFALESFRSNPLIAIQHDGDLSRIEDNTKLNSIVSHEVMMVNEKFKSQYPMRINSFLFMGTNKPVKITEAKSGILRRLIDVSPTGNKIPYDRYQALMNQIKFELGAIAYHCLAKYQKMGESYYDKYKPTLMMGATNDFYNFVSDNYEFFCDPEGVTLDSAWAEYLKYSVEARLLHPYTRRVFKEELKSYFTEYHERAKGRYKVYSGFRKEKFDYVSIAEAEKEESAEGGEYSLKLDETESIFDMIFADCPAQEAKGDETPEITWARVRKKLKDIDTKKVHYVFVPDNLVVIDFDLKDKDGNKDPVANLVAASKWPATYAEYSKSGGGIHLHYIYDGDVTKLSRIVEPGIEVKVFKKLDGTRGFSSLRRKLTKCNNLPIKTINSGLPLRKGANDVVSFEGLKSEKAIRTLIMRALNKEYHGFTAPNVDLIFKTLEDAYNNDVVYDVTDLRNAILTFASKSSNQASRCIDLVSKMKFSSKNNYNPEVDADADRFFGKSAEVEAANKEELEKAPIIFFDVEVFPNLLVICWKYDGTPREQTVKMINPKPEEVKALFKYRLIGFNNRKYDNHILYAASLGYTNERLYYISHGMITTDKKENKQFTFKAAYSISYTDIYDFCFKKQSLKKWEIEMGVHHQELGLPWDQPVAKELWEKVADYCVNDVVATEALFHYKDVREDWTARQILADIADGSVNDTTNSLTLKLVFGDNKTPDLVYTDFRTGKQMLGRKTDKKDVTNPNIINVFPTYYYARGEDNKIHNFYRGVEIGRGGYVVGKPGMYTNVALLDIASMHPTSAEQLNKMGEYTENYSRLKRARVLIKHEEYDEAGKLFDGKLKKYLTSKESAAALSKALKYPINALYGISTASFENPAKDPRDVNNIIALRGALFMKTLQDEVEKLGYNVIAIRTDSIKIPDATSDIIQFVIDFGKKYGYEFEHECTYEKMCLVNDAVYIAKYDEFGDRTKHGKYAGEWTATGAQFQQPYVFKTLFSKEPIEHKDVCETKEVSKGSGIYLDMNEALPEGEHDYIFVGRVGQFCPIKHGCGGGVLVREKDGKYDAVTGTKKPSYDKASGEEPTYRWLESEVVENTNRWDDVDTSYYKHLVDEAVSDISKYGDFEWFVSNDPIPKPKEKEVPEDFMNVPETDNEELPF